MMGLLDLDWQTIASNLTLLSVAYALTFPIGWNREQHDRSAGLRTFPLVAVATCGFMLVGIDVLDSAEGRARALAGVITGMGFIGGGAILKNDKTVRGTATAASLWSTGAIGVAVAWQRFEIALVLALVTFLTLQFVPSVKPMVVDPDAKDDEERDPG